MKYLGYILRNARRNPLRSSLTVLSIGISGFLIMILMSFLTVNTEVAESLRIYNRVVTMSSQGLAQPVPSARVREISGLDGVVATTPFNWYGGKYGDDPLPFAQFGVDADTFFAIYDDFRLPPDQIKAFQADKAGAVIGRKLAEDKNLKVGDPLPLKGDTYPIDLDLTIRGIYDANKDRDLRTCYFHWSYMDEKLRRDAKMTTSNAGVVVAKCKDAEMMPTLCKRIDELYKNSDTPTKSQTEEAFNKMFAEMFGDMRLYIAMVGVAVGVALVCVAGVAMAMSMRERTTEIAVLKAIGFRKPLVLFLVLAESVLIAGIGGALGSLGAKVVFDVFDVGKYAGGFLPFFYVPWTTALLGLGASLVVGLVSGLLPAAKAANLSVIDGLRKVV